MDMTLKSYIAQHSIDTKYNNNIRRVAIMQHYKI